MPLNKRSELPGVVNSEGGWNVHLGITRRVAMSPNGKDQRLAARGAAIIHDDVRESFASCG